MAKTLIMTQEQRIAIFQLFNLQLAFPRPTEYSPIDDLVYVDINGERYWVNLWDYKAWQDNEVKNKRSSIEN